MRVSIGAGALCLAAVLACGGTDRSTHPVEKPSPVAIPLPTEKPGPSIPASLEACHEIDTTEDPESGNKQVPICGYREFDQMCSPDPTGCWDKGEACREVCMAAHCPCDEACANSCQSCGERCGDDAGCVEDCLDERAECVEACSATREDCDDTCGGTESTCSEAYDKRLDDECGGCEAFMNCIAENQRGNMMKEIKKCKAKETKPFCADACEMGMYG